MKWVIMYKDYKIYMICSQLIKYNDACPLGCLSRIRTCEIWEDGKNSWSSMTIYTCLTVDYIHRERPDVD